MYLDLLELESAGMEERVWAVGRCREKVLSGKSKMLTITLSCPTVAHAPPLKKYFKNFLQIYCLPQIRVLI